MPLRHSAPPCPLHSMPSGMKQAPRTRLLMDANPWCFHLPPSRRTTLLLLSLLHSITSRRHPSVPSPLAPPRLLPRPPTARTCTSPTHTTIVDINFISSNAVCRTQPFRFSRLPFILHRSIITRHPFHTRNVAPHMLHSPHRTNQHRPAPSRPRTPPMPILQPRSSLHNRRATCHHR